MTDVAKTKAPVDPFKLRVICPGRDETGSLDVRPPRSKYDWECDECDFVAEAMVVTIRSRRARTDKPFGRSQSSYKKSYVRNREFDIRVVDMGGAEHHLDFTLKGDAELEMRSGDRVVFFFKDIEDESLIGVSNTTIRSTEPVQIYKPPRGGCAVLLALGILLASAGFALATLH